MLQLNLHCGPPIPRLGIVDLPLAQSNHVSVENARDALALSAIDHFEVRSDGHDDQCQQIQQRGSKRRSSTSWTLGSSLRASLLYLLTLIIMSIGADREVAHRFCFVCGCGCCQAEKPHKKTAASPS